MIKNKNNKIKAMTPPLTPSSSFSSTGGGGTTGLLGSSGTVNTADSYY